MRDAAHEMTSGFDRNSLLRRLAIGASGQAFARLTMALSAVVWPSLMLKAWGAEGYGEWITLTSLGAFLGYTDFGLVTPSVNEIIMTAGGKDFEKARSHLGRAISFVIVIIAPALVMLAIPLSLIDFSTRFNFRVIDNVSCGLVLAATVWAILSRTLRGLFVATLYANGDYGIAYCCAGVARALELVLISSLFLLTRPTPPQIAAATASVATAEVVIVTWFASRRVPWAAFSPLGFDVTWLRRLARPAIGFAVSNLATQGVLVLGPRIALGILSGGTAVAIYAVYGTMMRLVDQCVLIFIQPLEVEMAHSVGQNELTKTARLVRAGTQASWVVFVIIAAGLAIIGPLVFPVWTHGEVDFRDDIFVLGCLMFGGNQMGRVCAHFLIATNRLYGTSFVMMGWALFSVGVGAVLAVQFGVVGMLCGGIIGELGVSLLVARAVARWLLLPLTELLLDLSSFTKAAHGIFSRFDHWRKTDDR
jgi:O-antigen/teichoic acid export membrane protein